MVKRLRFGRCDDCSDKHSLERGFHVPACTSGPPGRACYELGIHTESLRIAVKFCWFNAAGDDDILAGKDDLDAIDDVVRELSKENYTQRLKKKTPTRE